jgi:hypothetical protein
MSLLYHIYAYNCNDCNHFSILLDGWLSFFSSKPRSNLNFMQKQTVVPSHKFIERSPHFLKHKWKVSVSVGKSALKLFSETVKQKTPTTFFRHQPMEKMLNTKQELTKRYSEKWNISGFDYPYCRLLELSVNFRLQMVHLTLSRRRWLWDLASARRQA